MCCSVLQCVAVFCSVLSGQRVGNALQFFTLTSAFWFLSYVYVCECECVCVCACLYVCVCVCVCV